MNKHDSLIPKLFLAIFFHFLKIILLDLLNDCGAEDPHELEGQENQ